MTIFSIPLGAPFARVHHGEWGGTDPATVRPAYESRLGTQLVDSGGKWQSEDLVLAAGDGCSLSYYEFDLAGQLWPEQDFVPFTVEFGLYRRCNLSAQDADEGLITGTGGTLTINEGGPTTVVFTPQQQVLLPGVVWLGVRFSRSSAGLIAGGAPEVGHSTPGVGWAALGDCFRDRLGYSESGATHPFFNVRLFVPATCSQSFPAYANLRSGRCDHGQDANGEWLVDDARLEGGGCLMRAYEFTVMQPGLYDTELRTSCNGPSIPGTQRNEFVKAIGQTRVRHTFNPPIALPDEIWLAGRNGADAGSFGIAVGAPPIGWTSNDLCGGDSSYERGLAFSIYCDGEAPVGACCDMHMTQCHGGSNDGGRCESDEHCPDGRCEPRCREVIRANCPYDGRDGTGGPEWVADAACNPDPFESTCGVAACCTPVEGCLNLTREECEDVAPLGGSAYWDGSVLCDVPRQECAPPACASSNDQCTISHDGPGCQNPTCCRDVCEADPWCCQINWDRTCLERVSEVCVELRENSACNSGSRPERGPVEITMNTSYALVKTDSWSPTLPACLGACSGNSSRPGQACLDDSDCPPSGECLAAQTQPWNPTWLRFTALNNSIRLSTCQSDDGGDSVILLYRATDTATPQSACASLVSQACAYAEGCEDDQQSCLCFTDLVPGETYFAVLASRTDSSGQTYRLDVSSPCSSASCGLPTDCNNNGQPDLLDLAYGHSFDCQGNLIPDECEVADEGDCNQNLVPDNCDVASGFSADCNGNLRPDDCEIADGAADCDGNLVPDECQSDCDENGEADVCEFLSGTAEDCDYDGRTDSCEPAWEPVTPLPSGWAAHPTMSSAFQGDTVAYLTSTRTLKVADYDNGSWIEQVVYDPTNEVEGYTFGRSIAIEGDWMFVGTPGQTFGPNVQPGAVYIFQRLSGAWLPMPVVFPDSLHHVATFGWSLSVEGDLLVVGSPTAPNGGAAYVFQRVGQEWVQRQELRPPEQSPNMRFGISVSVSGAVVAVSQWIDESDSRAAHLYRRRGPAFEYQRPITFDTGEVTYALTTSVSLAGNKLALGVARGSNSGQYRGHALLYTLRGPEFELGPVSTINSTVTQFGYSIDFYGDTLVVGTESGSMSVVVFSPLGFGSVPRQSTGGGNVQTDGMKALGGRTLLRLGPTDCDGSQTADLCEIDDGLAVDCNGNRVPDVCDDLAPFDRDFDLDVDLLDFARMQRCFTGPGGSLGVADCCGIFDAAGTGGTVDALDYAAFPSGMSGP